MSFEGQVPPRSNFFKPSGTKESSTAVCSCFLLGCAAQVLTDRWDMDEDETMVALNPATTVAGMPKAQREGLRNVVGDWYQCSRNKAVALKRP